mgnify:FL=1
MQITKNKILISAGMILLLAILITTFSMYHTKHLGSTFFQYPLFLYGTTILSLAIGGYIVYLFEDKISKVQIGKLLSILPPDERRVMKLLLERKEIEQNKLGTLAELSPVKISRAISILEQRGIIEKKKHGYTNLIVLKI